MAGRAQTSNPIRRIARIASRQARLDMRGTSGAGRVAASSPAPASVTRVSDDGEEVWTALTELDTTDDVHALTDAS